MSDGNIISNTQIFIITNLMSEVSWIANKNVSTIDLSSAKTVNTDCTHLNGAHKGQGSDGHQPCGFYFYRSLKNALQFKI